jgi:hypothetical protein
MTREDDVAEIEAVVRKIGGYWMTQDTQAQIDMWDRDYPTLSHLPSELYEPLKTFKELTEYWPAGPVSFGAKAWDITNLTVDIMSDDLAFALAIVRVPYDLLIDKIYVPDEYLFPGCGPKNALWLGRLTYLFRRTEAGWKIIHCEDSVCHSFRLHQLWTYHKSLAESAMEDIASQLDSESTEKIREILKPILNPPPEEYPVSLMPTEEDFAS